MRASLVLDCMVMTAWSFIITALLFSPHPRAACNLATSWCPFAWSACLCVCACDFACGYDFFPLTIALRSMVAMVLVIVGPCERGILISWDRGWGFGSFLVTCSYFSFHSTPERFALIQQFCNLPSMWLLSWVLVPPPPLFPPYSTPPSFFFSFLPFHIFSWPSSFLCSHFLK